MRTVQAVVHLAVATCASPSCAPSGRMAVGSTVRRADDEPNMHK
jgi:hypothetical protein